LILVRSFALCPVPGFDVIKLKIVIDFYIVDAHTPIEQQPVFIDAKQAS
jgi:hypothetical protein